MSMQDDRRRVFCIGRNYAQHAAELSNPVPAQPVIFMKPGSSIVRPGKVVHFPSHGCDLQHEVELVVEVGAPAGQADGRCAPLARAVTVGVDLTLRDVQADLKARGLPWELAKAFDQSALVGDLVPLDARTDLGCLAFSCSVNGLLRQSGNSADMLFSFTELLLAIDAAWKLRDGDLVFTGTPAGVGTLRIGDRISIDCDMTGAFEWQIVAPRRRSDRSPQVAEEAGDDDQ